MAKRMQFSNDVTVGPQPDREELHKLPAEGFRSVVNFRTDGEDEQPISPEQEREVVEQAGLQYLHIPVSMKNMDQSTVDSFREHYAQLPKPVFAHCKSGKRAGAMLMMHTAVEKNMSGEQALDQAKQMGFECDKPELVNLVKQYVNQHSNQTAS